ncbi:hypothetical protein B0T22DRAFT_484340 [Podospora appendiculata]|uniref:RING-type domain-containing protein n=1 Tax=Podospora appendiculata TaxID=314037 RepID=A0AAE0X0Q7_9PEZI|nr:hypothetical protein B0T22DRAFT_484340 [Podospora appendiculata]
MSNNEQQPADHGRQEESLWHKIKDYLFGAQAGPAPYAECNICMNAELQIHGIPPTSDTVERKRGTVLPCGHMMCTDCWIKLRASILVSQQLRPHLNARLECPMCKLSLTFAGCGCQVRGHLLPRDGAAAACDCVPATTPEGGAVPDRCTECRYSAIAAQGVDMFNVSEIVTRPYITDVLSRPLHRELASEWPSWAGWPSAFGLPGSDPLPRSNHPDW